MGFVETGGARLHYEVSGKGEALVLLHGNGENLRYFAGQVPAFAERYRVIALDTRSHGESTRGDGPLDFARFADDVCVVLDELGVDSAHVLGYSDGGNTALTLALRRPDRVRSLIVNGANLDPHGLGWKFRVPATLAWLAAGPVAPLSKTLAHKRELLGLMVHHPHIPAADLDAIEVPTLVVVGERDPIPRGHTELIAHSIPGAELVILPGAGHACAQERPDDFNTVVVDFLARAEMRS
ncbi:alpha/beta fold hydrolase [Prescottella agglutinans]|uniref:Pimeloyl-ACP methyl ester carboxylesterase n=1 Tax=Prescottella agglutinans TaxID=1644129 RepID=A0ABT6M9L9_9NOCA|nr:alpha/beta fold hydrolase [Prescottella agglutinans]MDH6280619.1 pimeloyl-ACP methyl ester carboxylesterase [Prescottella agglutinans]